MPRTARLRPADADALRRRGGRRRVHRVARRRRRGARRRRRLDRVAPDSRHAPALRLRVAAPPPRRHGVSRSHHGRTATGGVDARTTTRLGRLRLRPPGAAAPDFRAARPGRQARDDGAVPRPAGRRDVRLLDLRGHLPGAGRPGPRRARRHRRRRAAARRLGRPGERHAGARAALPQRAPDDRPRALPARRRARARAGLEGLRRRPQRGELDHSATVVLVDAQGRQRVGFPHDQLTPEALAHDIRAAATGASGSGRRRRARPAPRPRGPGRRGRRRSRRRRPLGATRRRRCSASSCASLQAS